MERGILADGKKRDLLWDVYARLTGGQIDTIAVNIKAIATKMQCDAFHIIPRINKC